MVFGLGGVWLKEFWAEGLDLRVWNGGASGGSKVTVECIVVRGVVLAPGVQLRSCGVAPNLAPCSSGYRVSG